MSPHWSEWEPDRRCQYTQRVADVEHRCELPAGHESRWHTVQGYDGRGVLTWTSGL